MKKIIGTLLVLALLAAICLPTASAAAGENLFQRIFSQDFVVQINPLEVEVIEWPDYQRQPGEEVQLTIKVKNCSPAIEEVIYDLGSNYGLGGISAIIDYDGPSGPKAPEPFNWHKVPIFPNEEQYLYLSFPLPAIYEEELSFYITVDRWLGARG